MQTFVHLTPKFVFCSTKENKYYIYAKGLHLETKRKINLVIVE